MKRKFFILFFFFFLFWFYSISVNGQTTASFTAPDTVCVNTPVTITNTSTGTTSNYWNFCVADVNANPQITSLGNVGNNFSVPAYMDYAYENGNYYGFIVNNSPGGLVRLDFGNSLLNAPTSIYLGNFSGIISNSSQGIQVVKNNGKWYAIIVGGDPGTIPATSSWILKVDFGTSLTNLSPVATNWGNVGNMNYPHDLYLFQDVANNWYGFTISYRNSTITKFSFGADFNSPPTGVNLGNLGNLNGPTGICPINDNGVWRVFVTNFDGNSISRIDFGNSLLNAPSGSNNLGNPGNFFSNPRDVYLFNYCNQSVGFVVNNNSTITRLNFNNLISAPTATSLGNIGVAANIHSISKVFRIGSDLFAFLPSSSSNTLTQLKFSGCTNSSIPNSALATPLAITYSAPGVYNINLTVDDGLPTQATVCKQVVVNSPDQITITKDTSICNGDSVQLNISNAKSYLWTPATGLSNSVIANPKCYPSVTTNYAVTINDKNSCIQQLAVKVSVVPVPVITKSKDTSICLGGSAQLLASGGDSYQWSPSAGLSNSNIANPVASSATTTKYYIQVTNSAICMVKDSVSVTVLPQPVFAVIPAVNNLCIGDSALLTASGGDTYEWLVKTGVTSPYNNKTGVQPVNSTQYAVKITNNNCHVTDTVYLTVSVNPLPIITISKSGDIDCSTASIQLTASGGAQYLWSPSTGLSAINIANPAVQVAQTTTYGLTVTSSKGCIATDSVKVFVTNSAGTNPYLMPNAFTPNNDGLNDCFGFSKWGTIKQLEFSIYNRWGQLIFYTRDQSKCWDGNFGGIQQQSGAYIYLIKASTGCAEIRRSGTFVLIR